MLPNRVGCIVNYGDLIEQNSFHIARQSQKGHLQEISTLAYSLCMALTNFIGFCQCRYLLKVAFSALARYMKVVLLNEISIFHYTTNTIGQHFSIGALPLKVPI